jgi:hypothetical protein
MYVALLPTLPTTNNRNNNNESVSNTTASTGNTNADVCNKESADASTDPAGNSTREKIGIADDHAGLLMHDNYVFPCFLVFALHGPILHPDMRHYQSHLIMVKPKGNKDSTSGHDELPRSEQEEDRSEARSWQYDRQYHTPDCWSRRQSQPSKSFAHKSQQLHYQPTTPDCCNGSIKNNH